MADSRPTTNSDQPITPELVPVNAAEPTPASKRSGARIERFEATTITYQGEIPPWILKEYEEFYPGFTERLLTRVEVQSTHRQKMESAVVLGNIHNARLVSVLGTIIVLGSMILAGFLALHGLSGVAVGIVMTEIAALAGVALYRNHTKSEERIKKDANKRLSKQKQIEQPDRNRENDSTED